MMQERHTFRFWRMPSPSPFEKKGVSSFYAIASDTNDAGQDESSTTCAYSRKEEIPTNNNNNPSTGPLDPTPIDPFSCNVVLRMTPLELFARGEGLRLLEDFTSIFHPNSNSSISVVKQTQQHRQETQPDPHDGYAKSDKHSSSATSANSALRPDDEESTSEPSFVTVMKDSEDNHGDRWDDRFDELRCFVKHHGHCHIPTRLESSPSLARWCKRQRYQFKLKQAGEHSTLTDDREHKLGDLGFVWDSHSSSWDEKFGELVEFQMQHGHTNVPRSWDKLGSWVKSQRRQHALYIRGEKSHLTQSRVAKLNSLEFEWVGSKSPFPKQASASGCSQQRDRS